MIQNFTKVKPVRHDNFIRLFKRVMNDSELTPLQKIILSDVISLQIQGNRYFKTSKALAKELGNVAMKTIQDNFQKLNKMGYLDTFPFKPSHEETFSLREARVIEIEKWISDEDTYENLNLSTKKRELKDKDHPLRKAWPNRNASAKSPQSSDNIIKPEDSTISQKTNETVGPSLPIIHSDHINRSYSIRDRERSEIRKGKKLDFFKALVDFDDSCLLEDVLVKVVDRTNPKLTHMPKSFIFEDWSPDAPTSLEDDLMDASENLD